MKVHRNAFIALGAAAMAALSLLMLPSARGLIAGMAPRPQLSAPLTYQILATTAEARLALRFFETAVKTD